MAPLDSASFLPPGLSLRGTVATCLCIVFLCVVGIMVPDTIGVAVLAVAHAERRNTPSSFMLVGAMSATSEM